MHWLNLQLYARTTSNSFNERLSVHDKVLLTANPTPVALSIAAPEGEQILEVRLDPNDKASTFVLHRLNVVSDEGQQLYSWDGTLENLTGLSDIKPESVNGRVVLECTSDDPYLLISLPGPHAGKILLDLSVSHALMPENGSEAGEPDPTYAFQVELAEAILSLQSSFNQALEDLAAEIEGLQDAFVINSVNARRDSDAAARLADENRALFGSIESTVAAQLGSVVGDLSSANRQGLAELAAAISGIQETLAAEAEVGGGKHDSVVRQLENILESGRRFEEQASKLQDRLRAEALAIDAKIESVRVEEHFALLREYIQTESGGLNASMRASLGAAIAELSAGSQEEFAKLAAQVASFADAKQLLQHIRAELNIARDEDIVLTVQQLLAEVRGTRGNIKAMEASLAWRLTRHFAIFSKKPGGI